MELSFGEQVKILLKRNNMTIRELAETIERETGKKMTRQNLTQRLVRDNFKEQDMRMIASVLGCNLELTLREVDAEEFVPYTGPHKKEKEDGVSLRKVVDKQLTIDDVMKFAAASAPKPEEEPLVQLEPEEPAGGKELVLPNEDARERAKRRLAEEERIAREAREAAQKQREAEEEAARKESEEDRERAAEIARRALEATHSETAFRRFGTVGRIEGVKASDVFGTTAEEPDEAEEIEVLQEEEVLTEMPAVSEEEIEEPEEEPVEEPEDMIGEAADGEPEEVFEEVSAEDSDDADDSEEETEEELLEDDEEDEYDEDDEDDEDETVLAPEDRLTREEIEAILQEGSIAPHKLARDETLLDVARKDSEARAALSNTADMGVVPDSFRRTSADQNQSGGEINPHTGEEYESNVVRTHPRLTGYIQVYDREAHKWIDMTEWAFLGFQERKKAILGADYKPPIYLE